MEKAIAEAREQLDLQNVKQALRILKPYKKSVATGGQDRLDLVQVFADAYLENGQVEKAYSLIERSCQLDSDGKIGGCAKFFTLGQITGGPDGISIIMKGIENVSAIAGDSLSQEQANMMVNGLLAMIEIWMTDLCMEKEAESECEELISKAMEISEGKSSEVWSVLGSIKISQQKFGEASEAFTKAWEFFQMKKESIEEQLTEESVSSHAEYLELLQPAISLAKMCIEMGLYEISLQIVAAIKDIDEDNLESYYLEGFTYYLMAKLEQFKQQNQSLQLSPENIYEFNSHVQELPLDIKNESLKDIIYEARVSLSFASKFSENAESDDEMAKEIIQGVHGLLNEIGGALDITELMKLKRGEEVTEIDEIEINELE
ncbi:Acl4p [Kluyveromyces lactis]|uniref:KLLA0D16852p n=1 Tax=Kluyveromyces lactis (strain ATCC 8585 / CBS 2359 / DSM 70799 / NBRC 1267 / NRRL Y-1140 / WM37) TaxID=284590 RepID=Q6CQI4_KLULA|nr:uncharacterized protein KLLA0_D16852g [Kluyveromyces lactis]CAH00901.1 KLLA0D16852p [Kluyveromyces lactis]|eukprot:XP_453805.1 uncharacterized protein KLLA0_D16852g [Kluyveromyces lactis]